MKQRFTTEMTALQPFLSTALPIMFTILIAASMNGKGFDGVNRSFDGVNKRRDDIVARLGRIEANLESHDERIVRLEERTSPLAKASR